MMELLLKVKVLLPQIQVTLILDIKTKGSPTTDIGDADLDIKTKGSPTTDMTLILDIKTKGSPTTDIGDADFS